MKGTFIAAGAIALVLVALGLGQRLTVAPGGAALAPNAIAVPLPTKLALADALAAVRSSALEHVGRVDRIAAKLLTYEEYLRVAGPIRPPGGGLSGFVGDPSARVLWIVAVAGEVYPNGRTPVWFGGPPPVADPTPYPPYASGLFMVDAVFGGASVAMADELAPWPTVFDRLPNHPPAAFVAASATPTLAPIAVRQSGPEALSLVLRLVLDARVERVQYKLATWGEFVLAAGPQPSVSRGDAEPVWVVVVAGQVPAFKKGPADATTARWALYVLDAQRNDLDSLLAAWSDAATGWPSYFDRLPDHPAAPAASPTR